LLSTGTALTVALVDEGAVDGDAVADDLVLAETVEPVVVLPPLLHPARAGSNTPTTVAAPMAPVSPARESRMYRPWLAVPKTGMRATW
jgi:hypothetical protein